MVTGTPGPKYAGDVTVYMSGVTPPAFEEVAILQAVGQAGHADLEHVVKGLKTEASELGCNAVVNVKVDQGSETASGTAICARIPPTKHASPEKAPQNSAPSTASSASSPADASGASAAPKVDNDQDTTNDAGTQAP